MIQGYFTWDAHACLPLLDDTPVDALFEHRNAGVDFVSVNVGMDFNPVADIFRFISYFRNEIEKYSNDFVFAETLSDVDQAKTQGKMAISFDLEGSMMLQDRPETVETFYRLGVRQIHLAYNRNNSVAGGCHDTPMGLTALGKDIVMAVNEAGMMLDCSHMGEQTTLDVMALSKKPVIFSHTNAKTLYSHGRCITDAQIEACSATGGVIGISGVNRFIGQELITPELMADQINYIVNRVGIDHVGIGLDYMYPADKDELPEGTDRSFWWPPSEGYGKGLFNIDVYHPSELEALVTLLRKHGYEDDDLAKVFGLNFYRVAKESWKR